MVPGSPNGYTAATAVGDSMPRFQTSLSLLLAIVGGVAYARHAWGVPLERFESPLELECEHDSVCNKSVRSKFVLGGVTGLVLAAGSEGVAKLRFRAADERQMELLGKGEAVHSLTLIWDGDSNPQVLSAAGLGCFDLTANGASAFVLRALAVEASCVERAENGECPPLEIESRIYDAGDATGQRFSASVLKRPVPRQADELVIPFSNFIREGPHGLARPTCVGAISIALRLEGFKDLRLSAGPIYTNGSDGLTFIPTPTPLPTLPPTLAPIETSPAPTAEVTAAPTAGLGAVVTPLSGTPVGEFATPPHSAALIFATPSKLEVFEAEALEQVAVPKVLGAPEAEPATENNLKGPGIVPETEGEVVYGAVVGGR